MLRDRCRRMGWIALGIAGLITGLMLFGNVGVVAAADDEQPQVAFRWAFVALTGEEDQQKLEPITQDTVLKTGDRLKMMVELKTQCFVYVIHHNPRDEVMLLFPYNQQSAEVPEVSARYFIPQGEAWYELDEQTGRENFYVLASSERLNSIEELFNQYRAADSTQKPELSQKILSEIRRIKKQHREFAVAAERPVPIGGAIRGLEKSKNDREAEIVEMASEVSAMDFIAKTFTVEHQ